MTLFSTVGASLLFFPSLLLLASFSVHSQSLPPGRISFLSFLVGAQSGDKRRSVFAGFEEGGVLGEFVGREARVRSVPCEVS